MPPPAPKNIFQILSENLFNCLHIAKKLKNVKLLHYGYCELLKHKKICQIYFSVYKY